MADRSFGVREINIVGSAGTPTISSPNNINLNGINVAISTDFQVGRNVSVVGVITATSFVGNGSGLTNLPASYPTWTIGSNGSSDYTFTGIGFTVTTNDPVLYLARGQKYAFDNQSGGSHPFQIRTSNGGSAYNSGVTNNGASTGVITFEVPFDAPNTLYYQCTVHSSMGNTINIYPTI